MKLLDTSGGEVEVTKEFNTTLAKMTVLEGLETGSAIVQSHEDLVESLLDISGDEEFVITRAGKRLNTNCIRHRMRRVCDNVGIPRRSPHKIRKTYCSILFENSVDQKLITDQMGHTDIMCSELHYHRNRKSLDKKIETISAIPEFKQRLKLVPM